MKKGTLGSGTFQHGTRVPTGLCSPCCHFRDGGCQRAPGLFHEKGRVQRSLSKLGLIIIHALGFTLVLRQEQEKRILYRKPSFTYSASVFAILTTFSQYSSGDSDSKSKQADATLAPKDQMGNKWQYLQQELSSKMKSPLCQLVEPQVCLSSMKHSDSVDSN